MFAWLSETVSFTFKGIDVTVTVTELVRLQAVVLHMHALAA